MSPLTYIGWLLVYGMLCLILGLLKKPETTIHDAASTLGKLGRQTQLRTQAEKTRAIHDQLRESIGSSQDHARSAGDAAPRGRPA